MPTRNGYPMPQPDGIPTPPERPRPSPRPPRPIPDNDNQPRPDNDNRPRPRPRPRIPRGFGSRATASFALRGGARLVPGLGWAILAWDLWQILRGPNPQPPGYDMHGLIKQWGPYTYTLQNGNPTKGSGFRPYINRKMPPDGNGPLARQAFPGFIPYDPVNGVSITELYDYTALQSDKLRYISGWANPTGVSPAPTVNLPAMPTTHPMPGEPRVRGGTIVTPSPNTHPEFPPWVDPLSWPPNAPQPEPTSPPYDIIPERIPNPFRDPWEQTIIGPAPAPRVPRWPRPVTPEPAPVPPNIVIGPVTPVRPAPGTVTPLPGSPPAPETGSGTNPGTAPGTGTAPSPSPAPTTSPATREPPGKGEQEKKVIIRRGGVIQAITRVAGVATEGLDFINVTYDALPKSCKPGYYLLTGKGGKKFYKRRWRANQQQRIKAIMSCYGHIDVQKFVTGLVANQIEDRLIGAQGRLAKKAFKKSGSLRPVGLQTGPWDTMSSKAWAEFQRREEDRKERERDAARAEHSRKKAIIKAAARAKNRAEWRKRTRRTGRNPWG